MGETQVVLFDIGGVLTPDPYETIVRRLAPSADLSNTRGVWEKYAVLPRSDEANFWNEIGDALDTQLELDEITRVQHEIVVPNPEAAPTFEYLQARGVKIGVLSNNTAFFYPYQAALVGLEHVADPGLCFLSHQQKMTKRSGLIGYAAGKAGIENTLFIDDRDDNIQRARLIGLRAIPYVAGRDSLHTLVKTNLEDLRYPPTRP